jgi:dinuclear metal center YbgI/SA1388 family protein
MQCADVIKHIEQWAPKGIAWEGDNVGLQIGDEKRKVKNILLSLDLNQKVVDEAIRERCNFIFTHHPFLFHPIKKLDINNDSVSRIVEKIIKKDLVVYSAHTNLDFTKEGVSYQLAKKLKLEKIKFLSNLSSNLVKLAVFVPDSHLEKVANAIHHAGAGMIGEYSNCSFRTKGIGSFKGASHSTPKIGKRGVRETVRETKLEVLVNSWDLLRVISQLKHAHPYEEVAYDIYPLKNENVNFGFGAIGSLNNSMSSNEFLRFVSENLNANHLRFAKGSYTSKIKTVAVCGGSGSRLLDEAIRTGADAFVTADVKYHTFQDAEGKILLIDAGHFETEIHSLDEVQKRLKQLFIDNKKIKVLKYSGSTNPVNFYNN